MNKEVKVDYNGNDSKTPIIKNPKSQFSSFFNHFSSKVTKITGSVYAFLFAFFVVIIWAATGSLFHYSDTWQLVINTGTTIVTFLMVFIIQHSQNKDTIALQLKLDELISVSKASNKLISVENLSDEDLQKFNEFYEKASLNALKGKKENVSLDDAEINIDTDNVNIHINPDKISSQKKSKNE